MGSVAVEDAVSIKVGDKVKLLGWEPHEHYMTLFDSLRALVGTEARV